MIETTKGLLDEFLLDIKIENELESDTCKSYAKAYYLDGELVRRDVIVDVKSGAFSLGNEVNFG